jgi:cytochrome c-type biogenesis protein
VDISIGLVFLAGVVTFLAPCVLPVLPGYLTYLAARASGQEPGKASRWLVLFHGIAFVLGFTVVFVILGATASALGQYLYAYKDWISRAGGVILVFFGLQMAGILQIPFLEREFRKYAQPDPRLGYASSFLMGVFFSAGWTPCIGPTLGAVLTLAASDTSILRGVLLLTIFSMGFALPFLLVALAIGRIGNWIRRLAGVARYITVIGGLLLAGIGFLLILGKLNILADWLPGLTIYI